VKQVKSTHDRAVGGYVRDGQRLHQRFRGFAPDSVVSARVRTMPRVLVELGELLAVIYRCDKGRHGQRRTYIHFMETPPRLTSDVSGSQMYVVGGKYRVTARGIEG